MREGAVTLPTNLCGLPTPQQPSGLHGPVRDTHRTRKGHERRWKGTWPTLLGWRATAGGFSSTFAQSQTWQSHTFQSCLIQSTSQWQSFQEPMDEMSQTPPGYSRLNHMQHLQTLPHLLADKTALSMKSLFIFLFRNFTHGTDSHKHCKGALYFSWLVHTWRLEFRFQLFGVQNSTHIFGLISVPQLFLAAGLGRNETKSSQHFAHCVLCFPATSHQLLHTFYCQRQMVKLETWKISQLQLPESVPEPLGTIEVKSQIRRGNL